MEGTQVVTSSRLSLDDTSDRQRHSIAPSARPATPPTPKLLSTSLKECPILIVEDDADLREMMAQLLSIEGFPTETVANGREALEYLSRGRFPQVILLDLMMPVMDGWEFRRQQRDHPAFSSLPVVVLSAFDGSRIAELGTAVLKKPLDFDRLLEMVRRYCREGDC
jgi:CheY-like chemotaxis protein